MINKSIFGSFIREKRNEKGLTQKELAEILFVSESTVSKWEVGKSYPDITLVPDICKALDVSEHELIGGAEDTEYRKVKNEARLYRRISESFFLFPTAAYILALVICFISDICINKRLTFTPVVFGSLLPAFTFMPTCIRFTGNHKLAVFAGSTYLALVILFIICCVKYRQNWFPNAAMGTLLGYAVIFIPFLLRRYLPENKRKFTLLIYFTAVFILVIFLLCAVRTTVTFNLMQGMLITLYAFLPFAVISLMHLTPLNRCFKAAADVLFSGLCLYGMSFVISVITGEKSGSYAVDFNDWANCINGNIYLLTLIACLTVAIALTVSGIKKRKG